ncbi:MAG: hypothetical protein J6S51_02765 [Kiritimatiellae bacterium]|nr:hypothetical protein [Kiritimatiellia bacterium]
MSERKEKKTSVYRQRVSMAALQVDGLSKSEIASALAYEVEPFSGIAGSQAEVSFETVLSDDPSVRIFDVTVTRKSKSSKNFDAKKLIKIASILSALLVVVIGADFFLLSRKIKTLSSSIEVRRPIDAKLRSLESKISNNNAEASRLEASCKAVESARASIAAKRKAYSALMEEVASGCAGQMVVKAFNSNGPFSVELEGSSMSVESCTASMLSLTRAACHAQWKASPGRMNADHTGSVISFSCAFLYDGQPLEGGR